MNMAIFIFSNAAFAAISIQVTDNVIKYGKTDIDILCFVNGTSIFVTSVPPESLPQTKICFY